uniref:Uncharacterized protein n=1 Tax=Rhizophora mucronata TaxID=61149 RepID=A0A2P2QLZ3_RHIMU
MEISKYENSSII